MKRILLIGVLILFVLSIGTVWAENVLIKEAPITKVEKGERELVTHKDGENPDNCAIIRVYIEPYIPADFNLFEATGDIGIERKELRRKSSAQSYIQFYIPIDPKGDIRSLNFRAEGYPKTLTIEVKDRLKANELYQTRIRLEQEDWVVLRLKTYPGKCEILEEGKTLGWSDENGLYEDTLKLSKAFLFSFKKEGYEPLQQPVAPSYMKYMKTGEFDTVNMVITIKETFKLAKIGDKRTAKVVFNNVPSGANLSVQDIAAKSQRKIPILTRSTDLPIGEYILFVSKPGFVEHSQPFAVEYGKDNRVDVKKMDAITGTLIVESKPSRADVIVDNEKIGMTPFNRAIGVGAHTLMLRKQSYTDSKVISLKVDSGLPTKKLIYLDRTNNEWWSSSQYYSHHYMEAYYGMGLTENKEVNNYIGLNYTYIRHALGFNLSAMYGFNNQDIVATAGPTLTLTKQTKTDLDVQLLLGAGYGSILRNYGEPRVNTWVVEAGLRFGFQKLINDYKFSWWSLYLGAKYYDEKVVPTLGISMMPIGIFTLDYCSDETDFSHVFLDPMAGYAVKSRDAMVGASFAWQKYNAGFYTSFMYGVLHGNIAAVVGPAFHLTPYADVFDLTLYGGIGYGRTARMEHAVAGDLGLRFAFGDHVFNWYNFSIGCTTYANEWIPTFALSLIPIKGFVELAKIDASDFPSHYTEAMAAYAFSNREWMVGANYTWIKSHLGVYGSFLAGFDGSATINVGPVFRLIPDYCTVDLQIYQGVGWTMFDKSTVGGETGIRMGFKYRNYSGNYGRFGMYSFNIGVNYSADDIAISFGMSWPILGIIGSFTAAAWLYPY